MEMLSKHDRNYNTRLHHQDKWIKKRLIVEANTFSSWTGHECDFGYESYIQPRWYQLLGSYYEYKSRTSFTYEKPKWHNKRGTYEKTDFIRRYYRVRAKIYAKKLINYDVEEFYT